MGRRAQIGSVDENRRPQKGLNQFSRLSDGWGATLPRVRILQNVDHRRRLLPLEIVDDAHQIVEVSKSGVHSAQLASCPADALALPAAAK